MIFALPMPAPATADPASSGGRLVAVDGRALPLRHAHLDVEAAGGLARVVLTQRFVNPHTEPLHVTYRLPLPADGAVSGFAFTLGEKRIVGEVDARHRARERFETALVEGRTAALLEQDRTSLFTQEIGNVPPGEEIIAEIVIDQPLRWLEEGAWEWRFPTVVAPRYQGAAGRVADARKLRVDVAKSDIGARSSLAFSINEPIVGDVESSSHRLTTFVDDDALVVDSTEVRFGDARLDRDVVVRWPVATPCVGASLTSARPADPAHEGRGYGLLTLVPPTPEKQVSMARDLLLLIDTSGSMGGRPLDQVKRVALALVDSLGPRDRIEMIEFSSRPSRFRPEAIVATRDGKNAARKWIRKLRASGGTEMHRAVLEALAPLREDAQRQIVLMTDGFIGFESQIVSTLLGDLPPNVRLHTVGVGSAPNRSLTESAARAGRGVELIVGLDEDAERVVDRLMARTTAPLVTDLRIEGDAVVEVAPRQLPDLFGGCPALASVALAPGGGTLRVTGTGAEGPFEHTVEVAPMTLGAGAQGVTARFGREKVEDLEMAISAGGDHRNLDAEIEKAGLTFQIATRLTSWIATTEEVTVDPRARKRRENMPHALADGLSIEGLGLRGAQSFDADDMDMETSAIIPQSELMDGFFAGDMLEEAEEEAPRMELTRSGIMKPGAVEKLMQKAQDKSRASAKGGRAVPPAPHRPGPAGGTLPPKVSKKERERVSDEGRVAPEAPASMVTKSRSPWFRILLLLAVLIGLAVLAWWLFSSSDETSRVLQVLREALA